jgi:hypothetical protein
MTATIDLSATDRPVIVITRDFDAPRELVRGAWLHQPSLRDGPTARRRLAPRHAGAQWDALYDR